MGENNKMIATFMGFTLEREVVVYEYRMDFRSGYEKSTIFCTKEPKLQIKDNYENYFDPEEQDEDFEYLSHLSFHNNWEDLIEVITKIENLGYQTDIINRPGFYLQGDEKPNYRDNIVFIWNDERIIKVCETMSTDKFEAVYDCIVKFIEWFNALIDCKTCKTKICKEDRTSNYTCKFCNAGDNGFDDF